MPRQPFSQSSQARHWMFSQTQLVGLRAEARASALEKLRASFQTQDASNQADELQPLALEEEVLLLKYWEDKMQLICRTECAKDPTHFTHRLMFAAQMFFKRFFLKVSIMQADPKAMMLACLYLAGKVEEEKVEVDSLIASYHKRLQTDELVALELQLLQVLRFHLHTCSPFRCFQGLMQDLHEVLLNHGSEEQTHDLLQQLHEGGLGVLCESYTSDAPFLFSPQQIALEALERAILSVSEGSSGAVEAMRAWLYRLSSDHGTLKPQLDAIGNLRSSSMVNLADEATVHRLKQIDSRLRAVNKQIKRVIAERNQQEAKAAAIANAKREREKAQERAEGQRIMQQRLAEALRAHSPKCERDPGFIIKRRKTLPVEDGVKFESAGMSAIKEELKPKAEIKVENAP